MATRDAANMALSNRMAALMRANDELLARVMALMLACRRRDTRVLGIEYVGDEAPTRDELLLSRITHAVEYVEGIFGGAKPPPPSRPAEIIIGFEDRARDPVTVHVVFAARLGAVGNPAVGGVVMTIGEAMQFVHDSLLTYPRTSHRCRPCNN